MHLTRWLDRCLDICLPTRCLLCADAAGAVPNLCDECNGALPRLVQQAGTSCRQCAADVIGGALCPRCLAIAPDFERVRAVCRYQHPVDALVRDVKFHGKRTTANTLARLLGDALRIDPLPADAMVVPVPLHPARLRERGFDQNRRVLATLARRQRLSVAVTALRRTRHRGAQSGAGSVAMREANVAGAFELDPGAQTLLSGRPVVLFDDVMTSGATLRAAASALRAVRPGRIEVLVFARTPR